MGLGFRGSLGFMGGGRYQSGLESRDHLVDKGTRASI